MEGEGLEAVVCSGIGSWEGCGDGAGLESYFRPRHQTGEGESFVGRGSWKMRTIFLPTRSNSFILACKVVGGEGESAEVLNRRGVGEETIAAVEDKPRRRRRRSEERRSDRAGDGGYFSDFQT